MLWSRFQWKLGRWRNKEPQNIKSISKWLFYPLGAILGSRNLYLLSFLGLSQRRKLVGCHLFDFSSVYRERDGDYRLVRSLRILLDTRHGYFIRYPNPNLTVKSKLENPNRNSKISNRVLYWTSLDIQIWSGISETQSTA